MNQDLLDILTEWIKERDPGFWFVHDDAIACWPRGWSAPVMVFSIEKHKLIPVELGIVVRNNLKSEYSIYDPNFFDEFWLALQIHKNVYTNTTI